MLLVASMLALSLATPPASEPSSRPRISAVSASFAFEPRVGSYAALDPQLKAYGFVPVRSPFLPAFGLRGRAFLDNGAVVTLGMTYGIAQRNAPGGGPPTVTNLIDTTAGAGYLAPFGLLATFDAGFAVLTHAVGSSIEGGALLYPGPSFHPRVGYVLMTRGLFAAATVGYSLQVPVGPAHRQPLWEASFRRSVVQAFTVGIEIGFGVRVGDHR